LDKFINSVEFFFVYFRLVGRQNLINGRLACAEQVDLIIAVASQKIRRLAVEIKPACNLRLSSRPKIKFLFLFSKVEESGVCFKKVYFWLQICLSLKQVYFNLLLLWIPAEIKVEFRPSIFIIFALVLILLHDEAVLVGLRRHFLDN
jgi:hypothetical protein